MPLHPGSKLGPYEIVAPIGAGGMGEVYRALDTRLDRNVAIKVLPEALAADPERRRRFEREARAIAALNHPHICALYDIGNHEGLDYVVMELLEGETLAARMEEGALPVDQALRIGAEIADALEQAHRHGIIHRDLKPGNVMLTHSGAKLLDFGLALPVVQFPAASPSAGGVPRTELPTLTSGLTAEGSILGTIEYMSPERLEGREADQRSDIFSLGTVLYEMVAGQRPFTGQSHASIIGAILRAEPPPLSTVVSTVPTSLEHLVRRCLAKDPEDRWQSARDVAIELNWIAAQPAMLPGLTTATGRTRREWIAWSAALAFFIATVALAVTIWQQKPEAQERQIPSLHLSVVEPGNASFVSIVNGGPVALSPDGAQLAFVCADADGKNVLYVRLLDNPRPRMLLGTEGAMQPFWSPDGKNLGFFANGKLKRIDIERGGVQTLADAPTPRGGTWGTKNTILYAPKQRDGLYWITALGGDGGQATTLDEKTNEGSHRCPFFLPDGDHFLYLVTGPRGEIQRVVRSKFSGQQRLDLPLGPIDAGAGVAWVPGREGRFGFLLFLRGSSLMAWKFDPMVLETSGVPVPVAEAVGYNRGLNRADFSVSSTGVLAYRTGANPATRLMWFDKSGKELGTLGDPSLYMQPRLSPDGKRVAVERADPQGGGVDVWVLEMGRGIASRLTHDPAYDGFPTWSPNGEIILFMSERRGPGKLFEKLSSGAGVEREMMASTDYRIPTDWSRDGKYILFMSVDLRTVKNDLWVLPIGGNGKPFPFMQTEFDETQGQFHPSSKWIAYTSDASGRAEVYVESLAELNPEAPFKLQISKNGGSQPRWSGDGKELFYLAPNGDLMAVIIKDGKKLEAGVPVPLFRTRMATPGSRIEYSVTSDGRRFLINTVIGGSESPPISLMLDWPASLQR